MKTINAFDFMKQLHRIVDDYRDDDYQDSNINPKNIPVICVDDYLTGYNIEFVDEQASYEPKIYIYIKSVSPWRLYPSLPNESSKYIVIRQDSVFKAKCIYNDNKRFWNDGENITSVQESDMFTLTHESYEDDK